MNFYYQICLKLLIYPPNTSLPVYSPGDFEIIGRVPYKITMTHSNLQKQKIWVFFVVGADSHYLLHLDKVKHLSKNLEKKGDFP